MVAPSQSGRAPARPQGDARPRREMLVPDLSSRHRSPSGESCSFSSASAPAPVPASADVPAAAGRAPGAAVLARGGVLLAALFLGACANIGLWPGPRYCADPDCLHIESRLQVARGGRNEYSRYGNYLSAIYATSLRDRDAAAEFYDRVLKADPGNPVILERAFLLHVTGGDLRRAVDLARQMLDRDPGNRTAHLVLAVDALRRGDYAQVRAQMAGAPAGPFTRLVASLLTAWSYAGEEDWAQALPALETGEDGPGHRLFAAYHRALIAELADDTDAAARAYEEAMAASGGASVRIVQAYGRFLERTGRADEAIVTYTAYLALSPDHPLITAALARARAGRRPEPLVRNAREGVAEALYGLGSALSREQGADVSILYLRLALYADPDLDVGRVLMAELMAQSGDLEGAAEAYARVPAASPLATTARVEHALLLERMGRTEEAIRALRRLERAGDADMDVIIALGDILRAHERFDEAEARYSRAIAMIGPKPAARHWTLFYARGVTRERQGKWDAAEADFKRALELEPDQPYVLNYLGYSWLEQNRNLDEALAMIRRAVEQRPEDGFIVDSLGWAYYRLGLYEEAVEELERAVELDPHDPTINDHLGDAYWKVGRRREARFQWNHALDSDPEPEQAARIRRKLELGLDAVEAAEADGAETPAGS